MDCIHFSSEMLFGVLGEHNNMAQSFQFESEIKFTQSFAHQTFNCANYTLIVIRNPSKKNENSKNGKNLLKSKNIMVSESKKNRNQILRGNRHLYKFDII